MDHAGDSRTATLGTERLAILALLAGAVAIAFAPILVRLSELGPSATGFYRFFLAIPFYWAIAVATPGGNRRVDLEKPGGPRVLLLMGLVGACLAGDITVWHFSIHMTTVANATLLLNVAPVFVVLGGWLLFRRRVTGTFLVGLAAAMTGVLVLSEGSMSLSQTHFVGDLLGVLTAVFYASYQMTVERLRQRFSTTTIMICAVPVSALIVLPVAVLSGESLIAATPAGWVLLFALAAGPQVLGQGLIAWSLAHLPVAFVSVSLSSQPLIAATAAWILFDERIGPQQAMGAVAVLAGIVIARRGTVRR